VEISDLGGVLLKIATSLDKPIQPPQEAFGAFLKAMVSLTCLGKKVVLVYQIM
jgi:hypothetical protein